MPDGGAGAFTGIGKMGTATIFKAAEDQNSAQIQEHAFELLKRIVELYGPDVLPQLKELAPELLGESALNKGDPQGDQDRSMQLKALDNLEQEFSQPGGSITTRAGYAEANDNAANQARAEQATIQEGLAARGMGNSGVAAAMKQQASQNGTQTNARMSLNAAADQKQKALQALMAYGNQAGAMRGQDYQKFSDLGEATDAINKFNANMRFSTNKANNDVKQQQFMDNMVRSNGLAQGYSKMYGHDQMADERQKKNLEEWTSIMDGWIDVMGGMGNSGGGGGGMGGMMGGGGGGE